MVCKIDGLERRVSCCQTRGGPGPGNLRRRAHSSRGTHTHTHIHHTPHTRTRTQPVRGWRTCGRSPDPLQVKSLKGIVVVAVASGWTHSLAITNDGQAWVWGHNQYGQLGLGDRADRGKPVHLQAQARGKGATLGFVVAISAGRDHSIFLDSDGVPYTTGRNDAGQLGLGDTISRDVLSRVIIPVRIWCDTPVSDDIPQQFQDMLCVGSKSRVPCGRRCRGTPVRSDCGPANTTLGYTNADCEPLMPISQRGVQVQAGEVTSYLISDDGNLYTWGSHASGQLGIGPHKYWGALSPWPQLVVDLYSKNVSAVSGGADFTLARVDREPFYILASTPPAGAISGGTVIDIVGRSCLPLPTFLPRSLCISLTPSSTLSADPVSPSLSLSLPHTLDLSLSLSLSRP